MRAEIDATTHEWLTTKLYATVYKYNRNVDSFLNTLDSSRSLTLRNGLGTTVSGLPSDEFGLTLDFSFAETWEIELAETVDVSASDHSIGHATKIMSSDSVSDSWKLGLGLLSQNSASSIDNLMPFDASYEF